jgi:hypothetical protein
MCDCHGERVFHQSSELPSPIRCDYPDTHIVVDGFDGFGGFGGFDGFGDFGDFGAIDDLDVVGIDLADDAEHLRDHGDNPAAEGSRFVNRPPTQNARYYLFSLHGGNSG